MKIRIECEVADEDADESDPSGLTEEAHANITHALIAEGCEDIDINKA